MDRRLPGVAWVTGASKGIGRDVALALVRRGWKVAASARGGGTLREVAVNDDGRGVVREYRLDITDGVAAAKTVEAIEAELGPIDLAILNAGTHIPISGLAFDVQSIRTLVETNLIGTVNCLAAVLRGMTARRSGEIAVVSSMTGYVGLPTSAGYGSTKAALINMCEALRPELELHGVSMRLINPGFVDTPLTRKNRFPMPFLMRSERAAEAIVRGLEGRRFEITLPKRMAVVMKLFRLLPYPLVFIVTRRITPAPDDSRAGTREPE